MSSSIQPPWPPKLTVLEGRRIPPAPTPAAWKLCLLKEISVSWFALGMRVLEIEIEPVEEGIESDGETHTQTARHAERQREKPRARQDKIRTPRGEGCPWAHVSASASPGRKTRLIRASMGPGPGLAHPCQPPTRQSLEAETQVSSVLPPG